MAYVNSLAAFAAYALNTEPGSAERREALATLDTISCRSPDDLVLELVCSILAERATYGDVTFTGEHAASFSMFFNNSPAVANMREEVCAWACYAIKGLPSTCLNFADLGCGDGEAIGMVIRRCARLVRLPKVNLFLNDTQGQMISRAEEHVQALSEELSTSIAFHTCVGAAQEPTVTQEMKNFFASEINHVIMIANLSIHHMPHQTKLAMLQQMASTRPRLFILGEANSDHDVRHAPRSPGIVANAMRLYSNAYRMLRERGARQEVLEAARFFLGSEARNIILNDVDKRIDYHATVEDWKELFVQAGFALVDPREAAPYVVDAPSRRLNSGHFDSFVYEGEALCFTLGARAVAH